MGSLYQRGNVWWIKYYRNGKTYRESSKTTKKMVASKLLKRREGEIAQGKAPGIEFDRITFDELAADYIRDYEINEKKSLAKAKQSIAHLTEEFGGAKVPEITTMRIQDRYIPNRKMWFCEKCETRFHIGGEFTCPSCGSKRLKKGAANATINRDLAALRRLLTLGANQTPPRVNRVPYIPMLKENNVRKGFFEHDNFISFREELPAYLRPLITFAYKVGWRYQEVASLTWDDVDLKNGIATLKAGETKNNEARTVYLDEELKEMVQAQLGTQKQKGIITPYVFTAKNGSDKINDLRKAWSSACRKVGLGYGYKLSNEYVLKWEGKLQPGPIFHDLRRTAVRNMIRSGVPERVAMMVSGHRTRSVFDRYNIVNDSDLKMAAASQAEYLKNQVGTKMGTVASFEQKRGTANKL